MMRTLLVLFLLSLSLSACDSVTPEQCRAGDWRGIGVSDGKAGRTSDYITRHQEACAKVGIVPDVAAWKAGREVGLREYCTPQSAYKVGRNGNKLSQVCTGPNVTELDRANVKGLKYYALGQEISKLRTRVSDIDTQLFFIGSTTDPDKLRERRELEREKARAQTRISDLELQRIDYSTL